jgi:hypothetical protein
MLSMPEAAGLISRGSPRKHHALLLEDDVVDAVAAYLQRTGWLIESTARAVQHGDDLVARRSEQVLIVEAKGEGSSKAHTARFGRPFTRGQVATHVAVATLRTLKVHSRGQALAGMAFPDNAHHRNEIDQMWTALSRLGIPIFWVAADRTVQVQGSLAA